MRASLLMLAIASSLAAQATDNTAKYKQSTSGVRDFMIGATAVKVLIDSATLGGSEMELARLTFPPANPAMPPRAHTHAHVEVLYVLSGELDHVVNGVSHVLKPGMAGIVRPGDQVTHKVLSSDSARVLVIWAPGSELARLAPPPR
ncbi:MAG TPA: cupin domain-containing protein [Gemmatimonadaceae bacterium]